MPVGTVSERVAAKHDALVLAEHTAVIARDAAKLALETAQQQRDQLVQIIEQHHEDSKATAVVLTSMAATMCSIQAAMERLATRVETNISQRNDSVPIKIFGWVVGALIFVLFAVVGLQATDLLQIGS